MRDSIDLKNLIEKIVSSYEAKVEGISSLVDVTLDTAYPILNECQESLIDSKQERDKINFELRETLAQNGHLRKKDFDNMMQDILKAQESQEEGIKQSLKEYFSTEKAVVEVLKESLSKVRDSLAKGEFQRVKEFQALIKDVRTKQDERKEDVKSKLLNYQKEQRFLSSRSKELLAKGNELRIKDFKSMLKEIKKAKDERLSLQKKRKLEVTQMLKLFKGRRKSSRYSSKVVHPALLAHTKKEEAQKDGVNIDTQGEQKEL